MKAFSLLNGKQKKKSHDFKNTAIDLAPFYWTVASSPSSTSHPSTDPAKKNRCSNHGSLKIFSPWPQFKISPVQSDARDGRLRGGALRSAWSLNKRPGRAGHYFPQPQPPSPRPVIAELSSVVLLLLLPIQAYPEPDRKERLRRGALDLWNSWKLVRGVRRFLPLRRDATPPRPARRPSGPPPRRVDDR